jgi:TolB-like protein
VSPPESGPAVTLPDKPSIAVLPFQNMSGDSEQEYFADGMVEEIITALSRIRWLFVIARNSSFTYKGQAVDVKQVGRELGVRYVLEGSVRKAGGRVRITGQLIDAVTGAHLWADRFDGSLEDIFELQDKVAVSVAGIVEPTLQVSEIRRSAERPTSDLTAYDLYLRAVALASPWERNGIVAALDLLSRAIERDPRYGPALALAAMCHFNLHVSGWTNDPELNRREGVDLARQALQVASDDPGVLARAAYAVAYFGEDIDAPIELIDRALALNPSFANGWVISGTLRLWAGQPELAIDHFETSLRLSPHARRTGTFMYIGMGHFFAQRFEEAAAMLRRSLQEHAGWAPTYRFLAACYAHMGRLDEARATIERLKAVTPVIVPNAMHWRNPEHRELFLSGLRLAAGQGT